MKNDNGISIRFGLDDLTKEAQDEVTRNDIGKMLMAEGIFYGDLIWICRKLYIREGLPEGRGVAGLVKWLKDI